MAEKTGLHARNYEETHNELPSEPVINLPRRALRTFIDSQPMQIEYEPSTKAINPKSHEQHSDTHVLTSRLVNLLSSDGKADLIMLMAKKDFSEYEINYDNVSDFSNPFGHDVELINLFIQICEAGCSEALYASLIDPLELKVSYRHPGMLVREPSLNSGTQRKR